MNLSASTKRGYHHGDLRNALAEAATKLARQGGPDSITVRAAARTVGVTPTAAYRHFASHEELLKAAKHACLGRLREAVEKELSTRPQSDNRLLVAARTLSAAGRAYITFALAEPGLFRTCFSQGGSILDKEEDELADGAFGILVSSMDELVEVGFLPAERRPMAEVAAWSAVHGLAMLLLDGPLRDLSPEIQEEAVTRTLQVMFRGLGAGELPPELEATLIEETRLGTLTPRERAEP